MPVLGKETLHMNTGDGETSYANNSGLQKVVISRTWPILDETLKDLFAVHHGDGSFPKCFKMADLGCATGGNTLLVISHVVDTVEELCNKNNSLEKLPEFEVFLNDLPGNDFNSLFKLLPSFHQEQNTKGRRQCFVSVLPGSFYGRVFPRNSLHFAYSSYSLHWLSQIPEGVRNNNKANIFMAPTSPPEIFEAYAKQYQRDFFGFLRFRSEEIVTGGRMVLTFIGRSSENPSSKDELALLTLLARTLLDMVAEGLVNEDDLYSFNLPIYNPCQQEVQAIIAKEGSFNLEKMVVFHVPWDANDNDDDYDDDDQVSNKYRSGKLVADCVRAFMEPVLARHFGPSSINVDDVFDRYAKKVAENLSIEISSYFNIAVSLSRK